MKLILIFIFVLLLSCGKEKEVTENQPKAPPSEKKVTENQPKTPPSDIGADDTDTVNATNITEDKTETVSQAEQDQQLLEQEANSLTQALQEAGERLSNDEISTILEGLTGGYEGLADVNYEWWAILSHKNPVNVHINHANINGEEQIILVMENKNTTEIFCSLISNLKFTKEKILTNSKKVKGSISGDIQSVGQIKDASTFSEIKWAGFKENTNYTEVVLDDLYYGEDLDDREKVRSLEKFEDLVPFSFEDLYNKCKFKDSVAIPV